MDSAVLCLLLVGTGWGVAMTVIFCWQSFRSESKAPPAQVGELAQHARSRSAFLAAPAERTAPSRLDERAVIQVQRYLEGEQTAVEQFVSHPSVETLYRRADRRIGMN